MAQRRTANSSHAHACTKCRHRYEDNCESEDVNSTCMGCRTGTRWQILFENRLPKDCCRQSSRLATKEEKKSYRLAGPKDWEWWRCQMCGRTHPFNPNNEPKEK